MRFALYGVCAIVGVIVIVLAIGSSLPVRHRASRSATIRATPEQVFALITGVAAFPQWRSGLKFVDLVAQDSAGRPLRYRERGSNGDILFEIVERIPSRRLAGRIADPKLPFGGTWTYDLEPAGQDTRLTITEDGEIYNPVFRFVSRFLMGYTRTIDVYLADVKRRLG